ncbi:MAG TPA: ATP-binding protein [Ilumatobacteraceae bacterium]|jgi:signal transduction histidine kinase
MNIGTRVNVLIAVPLLALAALTVVSYAALQRASVRGDQYKQLKAAEALRSDIVAPPASLLESWSIVNHIGVLVSAPFSSRTTLEINASIAELKTARQTYQSSIAYWQSQNLTGESKVAFEGGAQAGAAFFSDIDSVFAPAMIGRDPQTVIAAVRTLGDDFNVEQVFINQSLGLVQARVHDGEISTDQFVTKVQIVLIAALGALVVLCLVIAFAVRRSIVRPIKALSTQASKVANSELAIAVHRIQSQPADAPAATIAPFVLDTNDELADLGTSFNSVQNTALALATEQANARRTVSENLVNIARRTQTLLGRSLTSLSDMEQGERDPEVLENLFRLDHLTTRMRRNAQSLLVLAGAEQNRLWSPAVSVGDVLRAAVSEIENYSRVDLGELGTVAIQGALAPDIAHLLAELLENATTFSSPSTRVMVVGRAILDGHQIAIVDYGIGMSPDELREANAALGRKSDFDTASSRMLGFQVVARIAARYGIQVVLAQTAGATGITAIVRLPLTVLDDRLTPAPLAPELAPAPAIQPTLAAPTPPAPPASLMPAGAASGAVTDAELWAMVGGPPAPATAAPVVPAPVDVTPAPVLASGLAKRVRGAQLPDLGTVAVDDEALSRPPEQVRNSLSSLQRGTDLGRLHADD